MSLNPGVLNSLINSATNGDEIDAAKLNLALSKISDKLFGIGESTDGEFDLSVSSGSFLNGEARGVTFPVIRLDSNGIIRIGDYARASGVSHMAIPRMAAANLPVGSAAMNGVIAIDSTNNRLVYYTNNLRYFIPIGTAF